MCCGNIIDETRTYCLCDHCMEHIRWNNGENSTKDFFTCSEYGLYERMIIFALKYNRKTYVARIIAEIMRDRLEVENIEYDCIVPVPMFKKKQRKRGFNHAALITKYLSRLVGVPSLPKSMDRIKDTKPMRGLNPLERKQNVKNMFIVSPKWCRMLEGKRVLLVDDIYTTGSTARECISALNNAGVKRVYFISFAAGRDDF